MSAKRALVVDDSRSARVILSRMLETHGMQVDTAESGEQALDYLRSARPDVVFMDHLMPGMDGFEAVRAMKSNANTAAIPVMMYTSQEGEHYMQQARKAGAIGVLSKTLKPTDVSRALYELSLLPDRRELTGPLSKRIEPANSASVDLPTSQQHASISAPTYAQIHAQTVHRAADYAAIRATSSGVADAALNAALNDISNVPNVMTPASQVLQSELDARLEARLDAGLSAMSNRMSAELRTAVQQVALSSVMPAADEFEASGSRGWFAAALIIVALIPTAVIATLYWRTLNDNQAQLEESTSRLAMVVTEQQTQIEQLRAELRKRQDAAGELSIAGSNSETMSVPYGELALHGLRIVKLQAMLERLKAEKFHGKLRVSSFVGDFCMSGNTITGYKLARDNLPVRSCDLIGNPFEDALPAEQRQPAEFASFIAAVQADKSSKLQIEVQAEGRKPIVIYPPQTDKLTAGEWNSVAMRNNRVEFVAVSAE